MKSLMRLFFASKDVPPFSSHSERVIGYVFENRTLLDQALTHRSYYNESGGRVSGHNERLEFLGDAALGLAVSSLLMSHYPDAPEGLLSRWRASLVNENVLAHKAIVLGLDQELRLGRGEEKTGGRQKPRLLACVYEAIIGALFVEAGFARVEEFIYKEFAKEVGDLAQEAGAAGGDFKTRLQEALQAAYKRTPNYRLCADHGPEHEKVFVVEVSIDGRVLGQGQGRNKKQAEQMAAKVALEQEL